MLYKIILLVNFFNLFNGINAIPMIPHDNNNALIKRQLTDDDISPNVEYFEELGYLKMRLLYVATMILLQISVFCSLYVIKSTRKTNNNGPKGLSVIYKLPLFVAFSDVALGGLLTMNLGYPATLVDNWMQPICSILAGAIFHVVISNILLVGIVSIIFCLQACRKIEINLGAYNYRLFVVTTILAAVFTVCTARTFGSDEFWCYAPDQFDRVPKILSSMCFVALVIGGFCYCNVLMKVNKISKTILTNKSYDGEMDLTDKFFIKDSKKLLGYLLIYNIKWIPLMVYVIADSSNYESVYVFFPVMMLFAVFGGILNLTQHLVNEGSGKSTTDTTAYNDANQ